MLFHDRHDAALQLIPLLDKYKKEHEIVLAVPRGGVPIGYYIAKSYNIPLELLMTKKIGHPQQGELAIGAVSLEDYVIDPRFSVPQAYIDNEVQIIRKSLDERYKKFMGAHKPVDLKDKVIIITDDGIATGNTILSAIQMLRKKQPKKIVVAVPVAPPETALKLKQYVDDFICLNTPEPFFGVGQFYDDFSQVSDEEVKHYLHDANGFQAAA
jgi:putative phosphoribosyl transferase